MCYFVSTDRNKKNYGKISLFEVSHRYDKLCTELLFNSHKILVFDMKPLRYNTLQLLRYKPTIGLNRYTAINTSWSITQLIP